MKGSFKWSISRDEINHHLMDLLWAILGLCCTLLAQWITDQDFGTMGNVLGTIASAGVLAFGKTYCTNTYTPDSPPSRVDVIEQEHKAKVETEVVPPKE